MTTASAVKLLRMRTMTFAVVLTAATIGCGGGGESAPPSATPATATSPPATFADQVTLGQKLYGAKCASCHGAGGEGGASAPRLVGLDKGALPLDPPASAKARRAQFKTAADVATFVVKNMPPGGDPELKEHDFWAILAFDLHANGVDLPHRLDASNANSVVLHK
jgi:S-disulfanyl-L-cysteine oxidoreductase SoxD